MVHIVLYAEQGSVPAIVEFAITSSNNLPPYAGHLSATVAQSNPSIVPGARQPMTLLAKANGFYFSHVEGATGFSQRRTASVRLPAPSFRSMPCCSFLRTEQLNFRCP